MFFYNNCWFEKVILDVWCFLSKGFRFSLTILTVIFALSVKKKGFYEENRMKIRVLFLLFIFCFHDHFLFSSDDIDDISEIVNADAIKIEDKIKSSVLWSAIGDALGRVTEFENMEQIYKKYPNGVRSFEDFEDYDFYVKEGKKVALYTDDTQMAMLVLENCIKSKKENLDLNQTMQHLADRFIKWVNNPDGGNLDDKKGLSHLRAPGKTCIASCKELANRKGLRNYFYIERKYTKDQIDGFAGFRDRVWDIPPEYTKLVLGDTWWQCGTGYYKKEEKEGGSGAVMRAWPFGICFYDNPELASIWAAEHSKLTHRNPISLAACAAIAIGVAYAIQSKSVDFITEKMIEVAKKYDAKTSEMMQQVVEYAKNKQISPEKVFEEFQGWAAHEAIAATIYIFNKTPDDVQTAVEMAVNTPGDSDTIATLVGVLVGAYSCGFDKIGKQNLDLLEDSDKLLEMSDRTTNF